jgi:precorrin-6A/cobalt-precorrin-6A reductase
MSRLLVLGGTGEARALAAALDRDGVPVTSSLAGRVAAPALPAGEVRIGGFGGPDGLARWLAQHHVFAVVDATHPYATRISASARAACARAEVPLLRLERPGWTAGPRDRWHPVADVDEAVAVTARLGRRVLLALGRSAPAAFAQLTEPWFLIRSVDPPAGPLPARHRLVLARGPFALQDELNLLTEHRIDLIVSRDSGGSMAAAKLGAARQLGLLVVLIRRPPPVEIAAASSVEEAVRWLARITPRTVTQTRGPRRSATPKFDAPLTEGASGRHDPGAHVKRA